MLKISLIAVATAALLAGCAGSSPVGPAEPAAAATAAFPDGHFDRPGFATFVDGGRLWVFRVDSKELAEYRAQGAPAKQVVRPGAGPNGMTLRAVDSETLQEYLAAKPGFVVLMENNRLWVFREGSAELAEYRAQGASAKQVIRPNAGPLGMTLKATDAEILDAYLAQN